MRGKGGVAALLGLLAAGLAGPALGRRPVPLRDGDPGPGHRLGRPGGGGRQCGDGVRQPGRHDAARSVADAGRHPAGLRHQPLRQGQRHHRLRRQRRQRPGLHSRARRLLRLQRHPRSQVRPLAGLRLRPLRPLPEQLVRTILRPAGGDHHPRRVSGRGLSDQPLAVDRRRRADRLRQAELEDGDQRRARRRRRQHRRLQPGRRLRRHRRHPRRTGRGHPLRRHLHVPGEAGFQGEAQDQQPRAAAEGCLGRLGLDREPRSTWA